MPNGQDTDIDLASIKHPHSRLWIRSDSMKPVPQWIPLEKGRAEPSGLQELWPWKSRSASVPTGGPVMVTVASPLQLFLDTVWAWLLASQLLSGSLRNSRACWWSSNESCSATTCLSGFPFSSTKNSRSDKILLLNSSAWLWLPGQKRLVD